MTPRKDEDSGLSPMAKGLHASMPYVSAVWKLLGGTLVGVLGGFFLDDWFKTRPLFLLGFSLLGLSVGFYAFLKTMLDLGKKKR